jgi:hypothetical protein
MHHIRILKTLLAEYEWNGIMLKRNRKTLAVCETCNAIIQEHGKYNEFISGEPYTQRRVRTVRGQALGNLPQQCEKASSAEPTHLTPSSKLP